MLKFIALSGTTGVTENLYVYETNGEMLVVDCGIGFPDLEMPGVDLVLPDFSYVVKNQNRLKGIVVSQGHEDHLGALPFLLREIKTEIWASPLVREFIKDKFKDYDVRDYKIHTFNPDRDLFAVGSFKIQPFRVTHSIPDTVGFAIDTPEGRIFHVPEHKMDQNPVDEKPFDLPQAKMLASPKVLFLASDCLGADKPGLVGNEQAIEENILKVVEKAPQAVFGTAISSNIGRFQQMINVAARTGRKVLFVGRSIQKKAEIAHRLGFLQYEENQIISYSQSKKEPSRRLFYIISGCYGQVGSSLYRLSLGEHDRVKIHKDDTVFFSADPAPAYSKESQDLVIDNLIDLGADVHYYALREGLYVSGHGGQEDIKQLFKLVKPKYLLPIGGTIRFMHAYEKLAAAAGYDETRVFKLKAGESVIFENGLAKRGETVSTRDVLVHGLGIGDIGKVVLADRTLLGNEGAAVVVMKISRQGTLVGNIEIMSRGFVFEEKSLKLLREAGLALAAEIHKRKAKGKKNLQEVTVNFLRWYFFQKTGRNPMLIPVIVEL